MRLIVMCGLQASGKTSFFHRHLNGCVHISKDSMSGSKKQRRMMKAINQALRDGDDVVVDNTNVTRTHRSPLIEAGLDHGADVICYYLGNDLEACLERNAARDRTVPAGIVVGFHRDMSEPSYDEGFDAVYRVGLGGPTGFNIELISRPDD